MPRPKPAAAPESADAAEPSELADSASETPAPRIRLPASAPFCNQAPALVANSETVLPKPANPLDSIP